MKSELTKIPSIGVNMAEHLTRAGYPTIPVVALLLLGVYGQLVSLIAAAVILGIGHIGIHIGHMRRLK